MRVRERVRVCVRVRVRVRRQMRRRRGVVRVVAAAVVKAVGVAVGAVVGVRVNRAAAVVGGKPAPVVAVTRITPVTGAVARVVALVVRVAAVVDGAPWRGRRPAERPGQPSRGDGLRPWAGGRPAVAAPVVARLPQPTAHARVLALCVGGRLVLVLGLGFGGGLPGLPAWRVREIRKKKRREKELWGPHLVIGAARLVRDRRNIGRRWRHFFRGRIGYMGGGNIR